MIPHIGCVYLILVEKGLKKILAIFWIVYKEVKMANSLTIK